MSVQLLYPDLIFSKQCATNRKVAGSIPYCVLWQWGRITPNITEYNFYPLGSNAVSA